MSGQVNARLGPEDDAELDRAAAEEGVSRGAIATRCISAGLKARREGGVLFKPPAELAPGDVVAMRAAVMEIDRIATDLAKHQSGMQKHERDDQLALTKARAEFLAGLPERIKASLNPIRAEMETMAISIATQPRLDAIDAGQKEHTEALLAHTAAIERLEKEPRRVTGIVIGKGGIWTTAFIVQWSLCWLVIGMVLLAPLGGTFPAIGVPLSHKMMAGDAEFCRLVDYRFERKDCQVPRAHRLGDESPESPPKGTSKKARGR